MVENIKEAFALKLTECLRSNYGGVVPSIAVVARDFSLKSPALPHVSGETVRKWLRGDCLPHISRLQVLVDWLGPEIATPFETLNLHRAATSPMITAPLDGHRHRDNRELDALADVLSDEEYQSILAIARLLAEKHAITPIDPEADGHAVTHDS